MKKVNFLKTLGVLGLLSTQTLLADYKLVLTDKDGYQSEQCIKSYSFSNNLESIAKQSGVGYEDAYTDEEVMTNKTYFGKPVYRKVFKFDDYTVPSNVPGVTKETPEILEIDTLTDLSYKLYRNEKDLYSENNSHFMQYTNGDRRIFSASYNKITKKASVTIVFNGVVRYPISIWYISDLSITVEYTKTTDTVITKSNEFESYLHYKPSSSTTDELTSINLKDMGIQFLEGYTYDVNYNSCTKN